MCTSPRLIINRSYQFDPVAHKLFHRVPCGRCLECQDLQNNEWFVRNYFEWISTLDKGGCAFFYTLTLHNRNLPRFSGVPCFDSRQVILFMKRLRKKLGVEVPGCVVRYEVTSEYGDEKGRPHYHIILYFSVSLSPSYVRRLVYECWRLGFVKPGKINCGEINSFHGIKYVCKYISKSSRWFNVFLPLLSRLVFYRYARIAIYLLRKRNFVLYKAVSRYLHVNGVRNTYLQVIRPDFILKDFINDYYVKSFFDGPNLPVLSSSVWYNFVTSFIHIYECAAKKLRSLQPYHHQSKYLGVALLDERYRGSIDMDNALVRFRTNGQQLEEFPLPRYFKRMLWFDKKPSPVTGDMVGFELNSDGVEHYIADIINKAPLFELDLLQKIRDLKSRPSAFFQDKKLLERFNYLPKLFPDKERLEFFVRNLSVDVHVLYLYRSCFRNRVQMYDFEPTVDWFKNDWSNIVRASYETCSDLSVDMSLYNKDLIESYKNHLFNYHPFFVPYEVVSILLDACEDTYRTNKASVTYHRRKSQQNYKRHLQGLCLI